MSEKKLSFQDVILRLLEYWQAQGCLIQQPYNVQVGAGTMNPTTVLRVLGPEPWNVVYVEPSVRPDDGRFGENPNRMQMHHQLQVILKPDPGNPQELYLKSLEAIGINPREHDIRFVEDNWESPALGAWGLGWEVWLDGQEISQYTYFQQAGAHELDPVSVELTYGLDRIVLALQEKTSVWEMDYGADIPYGDILLQGEIEHCEYYFNVADVAALTAVYDTYEREAQRCVDANLVIPAHDFNLKCSQLFNVLDTRGAIGVTQRADYFKRMRNMARQISALYLEQRQRLEYPFMDVWADQPEARQERVVQYAQIERPQACLLEIGSEELPVADLMSALRQLRVLVPEMLADLRLSYESVMVQGTPRRLAVMVEGVSGRQTDLETVAKGPPADRAFDKDGNPTRAAQGFARGKGVAVADLQIVEEKGKRYVTAVVREEGRPAAAVLAERLPDLIASIKFQKSMRWNQTNIAYSRPLRWYVALFGPDVVPFMYAGVASGRTSQGLRPYGSPAIKIDEAAHYAEIMRENGLVIDVAERQAIIAKKAAALAASKKGTIPDDADLLDEVTNLVERPTPLLGRFEERFLKLPDEVLVAVMKKHQRYFPVYRDGRLLPLFITVRNGDDQHLDIVADGNEHVIRARFADAEFFYGKDSQKKLADFVAELDLLTFQFDLGSMLDKTHRLEKLVPNLAAMLGLDEEETAVASRAAALAKADLASNMVVEMTSLQGIMGGHYAKLSGESDAVAGAIAEQYNAVSHTRAGLALALADRLDSLTGLVAAGLMPKGSNDPFALRRAALQMIENLMANKVSFDLRQGIAAAAQLLPIAADGVVQRDVLGFVNGRLEGVLREKGFHPSVVRAVLAEQGHNPFAAGETAVAMGHAMEAEDWANLLDGYARCVRITRKQAEQFELRKGDFALDEEKGLLAAYETAVNASDGTLDIFIANLRQMIPAITTFFDNVLVMDEETAVRENRLALLQHIANLTHGIADLSELEGF